MPKKLQQTAEQNGHALSREDRKNEQICRMIERAEKQRLKREEKKKLAVLNKAAGKLPVSRKPKKINMCPPKRTQVAIQLHFSDKARAQNASNRYYFDRKYTVEEKQRNEEKEMWNRYAMRERQIQQQQQQQQQQAYQLSQQCNAGAVFSMPSQMPPPVVASNLIQMGPFGHMTTSGMMVGQQSALIQGNGIGINAISAANEDGARSAGGHHLGPSLLNGASQFHGQQHQQPVVNAIQNQLYLNAGETGGNYEGGNEDQSGSSYFSSASKRQTNQRLMETLSHSNKPAASLPDLQKVSTQVPFEVGSQLELQHVSSMQVPIVPQQSLTSVVNSLQNQFTFGDRAQTVEESKGPQPQVKIEVQLPQSEARVNNTTGDMNKQSSGEESKMIKHQSSGAAQETCFSMRTKSTTAEAAAPVVSGLSPAEQILALTRQKMQSRCQ